MSTVYWVIGIIAVVIIGAGAYAATRPHDGAMTNDEATMNEENGADADADAMMQGDDTMSGGTMTDESAATSGDMMVGDDTMMEASTSMEGDMMMDTHQ
jgi:hypothetical protein